MSRFSRSLRAADSPSSNKAIHCQTDVNTDVSGGATENARPENAGQENDGPC